MDELELDLEAEHLQAKVCDILDVLILLDGNIKLVDVIRKLQHKVSNLESELSRREKMLAEIVKERNELMKIKKQ